MDAEIFRPERWTETSTGQQRDWFIVSGVIYHSMGAPENASGWTLPLPRPHIVSLGSLEPFQGIRVPVGERVCVGANERQLVDPVIFSGNGCRVSLDDED